MFTRFVVPLDGSRFAEAALAPACELAKTFNARILVVRALAPYGLPMASIVYDEQAEFEALDTADSYLHGIVEQLRRTGFDADLLLSIAEPGASIARAAALDHADLIVMATHLRWKVDLSGAASTTLKVLANSRVPILAWRAVPSAMSCIDTEFADRPATLARPECPILVPLDGSTFAESALPVAEELARALGLSLTLVRAVHIGSAAESDQEFAEHEAREYLAGIQEQTEGRGITATSMVLRGTPLGVIDTAWRQADAGLIVMASHGKSGIMHSFLGSVAARVIEEVEAPVLVVRPESEPLPVRVFEAPNLAIEH
jgi:nucleotide-binding universal stress UspA family protein